jgi:hypothetical protein
MKTPMPLKSSVCFYGFRTYAKVFQQDKAPKTVHLKYGEVL